MGDKNTLMNFHLLIDMKDLLDKVEAEKDIDGTMLEKVKLMHSSFIQMKGLYMILGFDDEETFKRLEIQIERFEE